MTAQPDDIAPGAVAAVAAHLADKAAGRVTGVVVTSPEDIEAALDDWEAAPKPHPPAVSSSSSPHSPSATP